MIAVDRLELEIKQGELFALLSMNGAEKTTTIKMLTCLRPDGGDAFVGKNGILTDTAAVKSIIGVSPQETAVALGLSVRKNLELMCRVHGLSRTQRQQKISRLSQQFGLDSVL